MSTELPAPWTGWYESLRRYSGGFPAKGTIAGALVVLERLRTECDLSIAGHTARGGAQIRGASGPAVQRLLQRFGENRPFLSEGGRTNRGLRGDIESMLDALREIGVEAMDAPTRERLLECCQQFLVDRVRDFHNRTRLAVPYSPTVSTRAAVSAILRAAREAQKEGPVAQYLVGAKLQMRFPNLSIRNHSFSTADQQADAPGDFLVGHTAFHVTVAPQLAVYDKCRANLADGLRAYLLVPEGRLSAARELAEQQVGEMLTVECIESFVAQNVDELSGFRKDLLLQDFVRLVAIYNERVTAVENDLSLLIELPRHLSG